MKLFSIVGTFDKKQWANFITYTELYHKSESIIGKIVLWLDTKSIWINRKGNDISTEQLLSEFPNEIRQQTFANALATLGNLAEEYLGWMVWRDSPQERRSNQLTGLAQKGLSDEYLKTQKEIFDVSNDTQITIWEDFFKMRTLFEDYYFKVSPFEDNYSKLFTDLIHHFKKSMATFAQFLKVEMKHRERLLKESWKHEEILFTILYKYDTDVIEVTDRLIKINVHDETEAFEDLIRILRSKRLDQFSLYIQYCIASYCIIFITRKIKQGETYRGQELLDLYDFIIKKGIISLNDTMSVNQFNNIIGVASKLQKYDWARNSVDEWAYKVDRQNGKTIAIYGQATIDFHQKKYEKVVQALAQMKSSNFQHRFGSRWLYLRAQYELNKDYIDVIKTQIDNFRRFIISNNSKINKQTFDGLKASLKILNLILDRKDKEDIEAFYYSCKYIFERKWILEKIKNPA